jgi:hypothetical protein
MAHGKATMGEEAIQHHHRHGFNSKLDVSVRFSILDVALSHEGRT